MSTPDTPQSKPWYKTRKGIAGIIAAVLIVGLVGSCNADSDDADTSATTTTTQSVTTEAETTTVPEPTTTEETTEAAASGPANVAEGVDPYMDPQNWWDEYYRERNCVSQDIRFGGLPICMARGVDMANDDTMLVFYVDQDEAGVQDHFSVEQRRDMFVDSLAGIVSSARADGDARLNHVTDVRVIATGGEGFFSGWQGETSTY